MSDTPSPIDEYTLSAFLAGNLPADRRDEVVVFLSNNADARELLCLAQDALEAASDPSEIRVESEAAVEPHPARVERPAAPPRDTRTGLRKVHITRLALAACVVFLVGLGLYAANPSFRSVFRGPADALRGGSQVQEGVLRVVVSTKPALEFRWNEVEGAYYYRLVIIDTQTVDVVAQHVTRNVRLDSDDAFVRSLENTLRPGHTYSLSVDAVDVRERTIRSSGSQKFTLPI